MEEARSRPFLTSSTNNSGKFIRQESTMLNICTLLEKCIRLCSFVKSIYILYNVNTLQKKRRYIMSIFSKTERQTMKTEASLWCNSHDPVEQTFMNN